MGRTAFAALVVLLALSAGGCIMGGDDEGGTVIVTLFDTSRSAAGGEVKSGYTADFDRIIEFVSDEGGLVVVDSIAADSLRGSRPAEADFPEEGLNDNPLELKKEREDAAKQAQDGVAALLSQPPEREGTAVLDALENASDYFAAYEGDERYLVIFSDMQEVSDRLKLTARTTKADVEAFLEKEDDAGRIPDLSGVEVYVSGAGVTTGKQPRSTEYLRVMETFWLEYFERAGANLPGHRYRATLTRFP